MLKALIREITKVKKKEEKNFNMRLIKTQHAQRNLEQSFNF